MHELNDYLTTINASIIDSITRFPRLFDKFKLPKPSEIVPFSQVITDDVEFDRVQNLIVAELAHNQLVLLEHAEMWTPFKAIWEVDKKRFFETLQPKSAQEIDDDIEHYIELANRVQLLETTTACYFLVAHSNGMKQSVLAHIDQWREGYTDMLKSQAYTRIKSRVSRY